MRSVNRNDFARLLIKRKSLNNGALMLVKLGERQSMFATKPKTINERQFGTMELVDREIFFISFNRRDT